MTSEDAAALRLLCERQTAALAEVRAERDKFRQILTNMLNNGKCNLDCPATDETCPFNKARAALSPPPASDGDGGRSDATV